MNSIASVFRPADSDAPCYSSPFVKYAGGATVLGGLGALGYAGYKKYTKPKLTTTQKVVKTVKESRWTCPILLGLVASQVAAFYNKSLWWLDLRELWRWLVVGKTNPDGIQQTEGVLRRIGNAAAGVTNAVLGTIDETEAIEQIEKICKIANESTTGTSAQRLPTLMKDVTAHANKHGPTCFRKWEESKSTVRRSVGTLVGKLVGNSYQPGSWCADIICNLEKLQKKTLKKNADDADAKRWPIRPLMKAMITKAPSGFCTNHDPVPVWTGSQEDHKTQHPACEKWTDESDFVKQVEEGLNRYKVSRAD